MMSKNTSSEMVRSPKTFQFHTNRPHSNGNYLVATAVESAGAFSQANPEQETISWGDDDEDCIIRKGRLFHNLSI